MSGEPQFLRRTPIGKITTASRPLPVIVEIWWNGGGVDDVPALATAWTSDAVQVYWECGEDLRGDWLPADKVHRAITSAYTRTPREEPPDSRLKQRFV